MLIPTSNPQRGPAVPPVQYVVRFLLAAFALIGVSSPATAQTLLAGTALDVRLLDSVSSSPHSTGRTVRALVIGTGFGRTLAPIDPGSWLEGTIAEAGKLKAGGSRHMVLIRFSALVRPDGSRIPCPALVSAVDNAREIVDSAGRILGLPSPKWIGSKSDWALLALGTVEPVAAASLFAALKGEEIERHRAFAFPPGVEMTVRLTGDAPLVLTAPTLPPAVAPDDSLDGMLGALPPRAYSHDGREPRDLVNVVVIGEEEDVRAAFQSAGWQTADNLTVGSGFKMFLAEAKARGYDHQTVSQMLIDGRRPDLVFQKLTDTYAKRHHIRLWRYPHSWNGHPVYVAAASHDVGLMLSSQRHSVTHRVDPDIDQERDKIVRDLLAASAVKGLSTAAREPMPDARVNDGHDSVRTDWQVAIIELAHTR